MTKLKTCPFCGGEAELKTYGASKTAYVECKQCRANTDEFEAEEEKYIHVEGDLYRKVGQSASEKAVDAWNRRANNERPD